MPWIVIGIDTVRSQLKCMICLFFEVLCIKVLTNKNNMTLSGDYQNILKGNLLNHNQSV